MARSEILGTGAGPWACTVRRALPFPASHARHLSLMADYGGGVWDHDEVLARS